MMGGGFDFDDDELGSNITNNIKKRQNLLLRKIDNFAILREYGINIPEKSKRLPRNAQVEAEKTMTPTRQDQAHSPLTDAKLAFGLKPSPS
jgi:hypothetical protein